VLPLVGGVSLFSYLSWRDRPQKQIEFWDLRLADTLEDVTFKKGKPAEIDGDQWTYRFPGTRGEASYTYLVNFEGSRVRYVMYVATAYTSAQPYISGLTRGSNLDEIRERLGDPSNVARSSDEARRFLSFADYNLFFGMSRGQVDVFGIYDPSTGPMVFSEPSR